MVEVITPQPPYPLHESIKDKIHPEYAKFYNEFIINVQQVQYQPVEASRSSGTLIPGGGPVLPVGTIEDITIERRETDGPDILVRVFTPSTEMPVDGWPVMVYYHGGGWVLGNIDTENAVCSNLCTRGDCVVITVDYRLAPENVWPAAVHDAWEALLWVVDEGKSRLSLNLSKLATGGSSAGGNLAAIMTQKALERGTSFNFLTQLLSVPVVDNTAGPSNSASWKDYEFTPALPAVKMMWYRNHYLPNKSDWSHVEASPLFFKGDWSKLPPALIMVGELDVLRGEGEQYGERLRKAGVPVELHVMDGMPHPFLAMDAVLQSGKDSITYMCEALARAFSESETAASA